MTYVDQQEMILHMSFKSSHKLFAPLLKISSSLTEKKSHKMNNLPGSPEAVTSFMSALSSHDIGIPAIL